MTPTTTKRKPKVRESVQIAVNSNDIEHLDKLLADHTAQDAQHFGDLRAGQQALQKDVQALEMHVAENHSMVSNKLDKHLAYLSGGVSVAGLAGPILVHYILKWMGA